VAEQRFTYPSSQFVMKNDRAKPARMTQAHAPRDGARAAAKRAVLKHCRSHQKSCARS
jgi:hypothetical protein